MSQERPRVVLVDDEPSIRKLLRLYIQESYDIVAEASNGIEALQRIGETAPEFVITDIEMPTMNGIELIQRVDAEYPETTVVVVSGYSDMANLKDAMAVGAREYITKPFEKKDVLDSLDRILRQRRQRQQMKEEAQSRSARVPAAGTWVFVGAGGGDGRTTLLLGLASELAFHRHSVIVVDADMLFGDVAFYLGLEQVPPDLTELLGADDFAEIDVIDQHMKRHDSGIRVIHAPTDPARSTMIDPARLAPLLEALEDRYEYVLVDLPFTLDEATTNVLDRARLVFQVGSIAPAKRKDLHTIQDVTRRLGYAEDKLVTVVTKVPEGRVLSQKELENLGEVHYLPRDEQACEEAVARGQPVTRVDSRSRLSLAIRELLAPILRIDPPEPDALPGLLNRLFG